MTELFFGLVYIGGGAAFIGAAKENGHGWILPLFVALIWPAILGRTLLEMASDYERRK